LSLPFESLIHLDRKPECIIPQWPAAWRRFPRSAIELRARPVATSV
jgi:hypothetical protein